MATFNGTILANLIKGTNSSDVINGHEGDDELWGLGGNDWIYGGLGNDLIKGGEGKDHLYGHEGNDQIYGNEGNDMLYGGEGNDGMFGGDGNDWGYGGDGNDHMTGGNDNDTLYGENGDDHLEGDDGNDKLYGGAGNDTLEGGYGDDRLEGGDGDDDLNAGGGNNVLIGGAGDDSLSTGGAGAWLGATKLYGGTGNDSYYITRVSDSVLVDDVVPEVIEYADSGTDKIYLGSSFFNEMVEYKMPTYVENLTALRSPAAGLWTESREDVRVVGNSLNNIIIGTPEADALSGGNGDDILMSRQTSLANEERLFDDGRVDMLDGGNGNDRLIEVGNDRVDMVGGKGNDTYVLSDRGYAGTDIAQFAGWGIGEGANGGYDKIETASASTFMTHDIESMVYTGNAANTHLWANVYGGAIDNTIRGGDQSNNEIRGYAGNDILDGGNGVGKDTIDGGTGNDLLRGWGGNDWLYGGDGNDVLYGFKDNDALYGGNGNDELQGDEGNDSLYGNDGQDILIGGEGDDWLLGGKGADQLTGGTGSDVFWFNHALDSFRTTGIDQIKDFVHGQDTIRLIEMDANIIASGDQAFIFRGEQGYDSTLGAGQLVVTHEGGNTWVRADVTGDLNPEFQLMLVGTVQLTASDFGL